MSIYIPPSSDRRKDIILFMNLLLLLPIVLFSQSPDWLSWRGGDMQGVTQSLLPTEWSETKNIQWQTPLIGEGHSSPIVVGKSITLTAGFEDDQIRTLVDQVYLVFFTIFVLLAFIMTRGIMILDQSKTKLVHMLLYTSILLIVFLALVFGEGLLDFERCSIRRWIVTMLLLTVLISSNLYILPSPRQKSLIGLVLFALGIAIVLFVPSKSHAYRHGWLGTSSMVMYGIGGIPVIIALTTLGYGKVKSALVKLKKPGLSLLGTVLLAWIVGFAHRVIVENRSVTSELNTGSYEPVSSVILTLALLVSAVILYKLKPVSNSLRLLFVICASAFGISLIANIIEVLAIMSPYFAYQFGTPGLDSRFSALHFILVAAALLLFILFPRVNMNSRLYMVCHVCVTLGFGVLYFWTVNHLIPNSLFRYAVMAFDSQTGAHQWTSTAFLAPRFPVHKDNSLATPTPASDGQNIYAFFGTVGLACLDSSGQILWKNTQLLHQTVYGPASSPVIHKDHLYLCTTEGKAVKVYAIDRYNGDISWTSEGPPLNGSSGLNRAPAIVEIRERDLVLVWASESLAAFDPETGNCQWQVPVPVKQMDHVTSLLEDIEHVYCIGLDRTIAFYKDSLGLAQNPVHWQTKVRGSNVPSGVVTDDHLAMITDHGHFVILNKHTGEQLFRTKVKGLFYASLIASSDSYFLMNTKGTSYTLSAFPPVISVGSHSEPALLYFRFMKPHSNSSNPVP
jgi:outer membrane protein assembly factor BamB